MHDDKALAGTRVNVAKRRVVRVESRRAEAVLAMWRAAQIGRSIAFTPGYYAPYGSYSRSTDEQPDGT